MFESKELYKQNSLINNKSKLDAAILSLEDLKVILRIFGEGDNSKGDDFTFRKHFYKILHD